MNSKTYAVDLSDVDVSIKPEATEEAVSNGSDMETELRKAKRLRDEGLINEE